MGPQGDPARGAGNARLDVRARGVRQTAAPPGPEGGGLPAHDHPDGRADRDPHGPGRQGPLGVVQHLQHAGPCGRRGRGRPRGDHAGPQGRLRIRLEGRDAGGILVVHGAGLRLRKRGRPGPDRGRRRRRDAPDPQGRRVREGGQGPRAGQGRLGGVDRGPQAALQVLLQGPQALAEGRLQGERRFRGDHHRRAQALRDAEEGTAALPGAQRQ